MERRLNDDRYVEPEVPDQARLDAALNTDDVEALRNMVVAVTMLADDSQATELVRRLLVHEDPIARGNAILGVGHLARRFGSVAPDLVPMVQAAARDRFDHVRGHAASAADDMSMFAGIDVQASP
jgi:hypothetical protein